MQESVVSPTPKVVSTPRGVTKKSDGKIVKAQVRNNIVDKEEVQNIKGQDKNLQMEGTISDGSTYTFTLNGKDVKEEKDIILPVVVGDGLLELRRYKGKQDLAVGAYGILEPAGEAFVNFDTIDLAIIPGMAFDAEGNRLGRGKGFYDRLLPKLKATKIGICFGFQVAAHLPIDPYDFPMDEVYTEEGKLSK